MAKARPAVEQLAPYVCARNLYKQGEVLLDANENAFASASFEGIALNRYPDPDCTRLREALAEYCSVSAEQILVGNGSDEIISLALSVFADYGDNVITLEPGYSMYEVCAKIAGVETRQVLLTNEFELDVRQVLNSVDERTRIVFVVSPNSVVGKPVALSRIRALLEAFKGIVFVDEAYFEFCGKSAVELVNEFSNLIVSRTLSKAWGLAGLRVGYCISCEENIAMLRKIKPPYNVSALSQTLAEQALRFGKPGMLESVEKIRGEREKLAAVLEQLGLRAFPSVANFLLVRFPREVDSKLVQRRLAEKSIIIRDRSTMTMLENCARITVGTPGENKLLLTELERAIKELIK